MATMQSFSSLDEFRAMSGTDLGTSAWHMVDQGIITAFARATDDFEQIHLDVEAARAQGLDGTIGHGLYTLSLGPKFLGEIYSVSGYSRVLNYGFEKVRFLTPVPVDSALRMNAHLSEVRPIDGGSVFRIRQTYEVRRATGAAFDRPACVAEALVAYFDLTT
jgi:acyl dehydratase